MIGMKFFRFAAPALLAGLLGGCIQPVHAPSLGGGGSRAAAQLSQITVDRVEGYLGYILKSELDFLLTGGREPTKNSRYLLKIKTQQSKASSIIDASTGRAQIATLQIEAVYILVDQQQGGKIKASGKTFASASFDRSQLRYATLRAERDAEERVAKSLAERLRIIVTTSLARDIVTGPSTMPELSAPDPEAPARDPGDEN
jgi:LPS-assembly lipoprotein